MRVLVVGGGGREHALAWRLGKSPQVEAVFCAPGNAGIAEVAECVPIAADDLAGLARFAKERAIDLTVVGPEKPLTLGIVDRFREEGLRAFGPTAAGAQLEGSKAFTKDLLARVGVPTAAFGTFADLASATAYVKRTGAPCVVKADGLAAGKGVFMCRTEDEALDALDQVMRARVFGDAGGRVVIEELLEGEELSFMALTDGETILPLAGSQDHKRIGDGDTGPNTGGMGAYSPPPIATPELEAVVMRDVIRPVVEGLARDGIRYTGILYAGLMVRDGKPSVLEFNVRLGDPEAQVLLARFASDLADVMVRTCDGRLAGTTIAWDPRAAVCVVLAAEGYPGTPTTGVPIDGLESLRSWKDGIVFHAGTKRADGRILVDGGRVLGVTALGETIRSAVDEAYRGVDRISWPGMQHRRDIGHRALVRGGR